MKQKKTKSKAKTPRKKPTKQAEKATTATREPLWKRHPVYLGIEGIEARARAILEAEGYPSDLDTLMTYSDPPAAGKRPKDPGDNVLTRRAAHLKEVLWHAEKVRQSIERRDSEGAADMAMDLMRFASQAGISLSASRIGKQDRKPKGILLAIRDEVAEHGDRGAAWLWRHLRREHADPGVDIDRPDFKGEVYFGEATSKLFQEPSRASGGRRVAIGFKAFEKHYSRLFPRKNPA